jgi:acetyltransferase-like isoleucine patch superfamily enzyme
LEQYLREHNFEKHFEKLCKNLKGKTVVIYGTGKMFQTIAKNYDLTKLNIIGVIDKKYFLEDEGNLDFGFPIIPYNKCYDIQSDCVLVATQSYFTIINHLKKLNPAQNFIPLVPMNFKEVFTYQIKKWQNLCKRKKKNNVFVLVKANGKKVYSPKIKNLEIEFDGSNNYIEIHEPIKINNKAKIVFGSDSRIIIDKNGVFSKFRIFIGNKNNLNIGKNILAEDMSIVLRTDNNQTITIGDNCLFSWGIHIRSNDGHTIYNIHSRKIINPSTNIEVGNHVWIAHDCSILKGTKIASNCIIGAKSLVNKVFDEEFCIIAGTPAKIIKKGVNWDRKGIESFGK